jgi:hypothetical protein
MNIPPFTDLLVAICALPPYQQSRAWDRARDWALEAWLSHDGAGWEPANRLYVQCAAASCATFAALKGR